MSEIERPLRERLLRASRAVYLATEEGPAKQISELLMEAEAAIRDARAQAYDDAAQKAEGWMTILWLQDLAAAERK